MYVIDEGPRVGYSVVLDPHRVEVQVEYVGPEWDELGWRNAYVLNIRTETARYTDNTLRSGVAAPADARKAWASAVSFLSAGCEAWNYGGEGSENRDLFPQWVIEIINPHIEDLELHAFEIEEMVQA